MSFRSAAISWLPGSLLFVGNIYAGSRALSHIVRHPPPAVSIIVPMPLVINPIHSLSGHPVVLHSAEFLPCREQPDLEGLPPSGVCSPATVYATSPRSLHDSNSVTSYLLHATNVFSLSQKLQQLSFIRSVDGSSQGPAMRQTL